MENIYPPDVFVAQSSPEIGRGVFANRAFLKGELVDTCPVVVLLKPPTLLPPRIQTLVYSWSTLIGSSSPSTALPLGYGALYNHNNPANMRYEADSEGLLLRYFAAQDIGKGDELTVNYNNQGGEPVSKVDTWFNQHKVTPIVESTGFPEDG
ncbi:MAG: SET domain-containing protein-lysine N-methyltransferase [Cellvibrionaceae bacterium]